MKSWQLLDSFICNDESCIIMAHISIDLEFLNHPKTISISPLAQLLFIRSILYSSIHLTDGFLPGRIPIHLACDMLEYGASVDDLTQEIVKIGWWEPACDGEGWNIHDFLEHQLSRKEVENIKKNKQLAGRRGGIAKAKHNSGRSLAEAIAEDKQEPGRDTGKSCPLTLTVPLTLKEEFKTLDQSQISTETVVYSARGFDRFWNAYPKKRGKGHCEKWFKKNMPNAALVDLMLKKIEQAKQCQQWKKDNGEFIPHPQTWLNSKGWEDDYSVIATTKKLNRVAL